jgi:uncharacterized protein (TIGR02594 family)
MVARVPGIEALGRPPDLAGAQTPVQIDERAAAMVGNAYTRLGASISEMGEQWQKSKDASAQSTLELETLKMTHAAQEKARMESGESGEGYTQIFMDTMKAGTESPQYQQALGQMSGLARQKFEASQNFNLTKFGFAAQDVERKQRAAYEGDKLDQDAQTDAGFIRMNPGLYQERLETRLSALDAQVSAGTLDPRQAHTKRIAIERELNNAKVDAGFALNPEAALSFLNGGVARIQQQVPGATSAPAPTAPTTGGFAAPPEPGAAGVSVSQEDVAAAAAQPGAAGKFAPPAVQHGTPSAGVGVSPAVQRTSLPGNVGNAYNYLANKGLPAHQVAGIVGNLRGESHDLNPNAINPGDGADGSDSIGIGQWNGARAVALKQFATATGRKWNDLGVQLDFMLHELKTTEKGAGDALSRAKDSREATAAMIMFERPRGGVAGSIEKRARYAADIERGVGTTETRAVAINPNAVTLPDGQQVTSNSTPFKIAQKYIGVNEQQHAAVISDTIRRMGGHNIDPRQTAWCAGFVNAMLGASGVRGTGSLAAKSFANYGSPTTNPEQGDIVVLTRGSRDGPYGHVGFFAGWTERDGRPYVKILGGNQGNAVSVTEMDAAKIIAMRKPPVAGFAAVGAGAAGPGVSVSSAVTPGSAPVSVSPAQNTLPAFGASSQPSFKFAATKSDGTATDVEITMGDIARMGPGKVGALVEKARAQLKVDVDQQIESARESLEAGGSVGNYLELEAKIRAAYGVQADKKLRDLERAGQLGEAIRGLDGLDGSNPVPLHERDDVIEALRPSPHNNPRYHDQKKNWDKLKAASDHGKTEAEKDPAKWTTRMSKRVQFAAHTRAEAERLELTGPSRQAIDEQYYDTLLDEQAKRGVEPTKLRLETVGQMQDDARKLNDPNLATNTPALKAEIERIEQRYGKHTTQYLANLTAHGVDASYVAFQSITSAPVRGELLEAMALDNTKDSDFRKGLEAKSTDISKAVTDASATFRNSLPPGAQKDNFFLKTGMTRAITLLTYKYMRDRGWGNDPAKAATQATNDILGGNYEFAQGRVEGKSVRIPMQTEVGGKGVSREDVSEIQQTIRGFGNVVDSVEHRLIPPPGMKGVTLEENQREYADALKARGYLMTNEDESGVRLYDERGGIVPLLDENGAGKAVRSNWTWDEMKARPDLARPRDLPAALPEALRLQGDEKGEGAVRGRAREALGLSGVPALMQRYLPGQPRPRKAPAAEAPAAPGSVMPGTETMPVPEPTTSPEFGGVPSAATPTPEMQQVHAKALVNYLYGQHLEEYLNQPDPERLEREQAVQAPPLTPRQLQNFLEGDHLEEITSNPQVQILLNQLDAAKPKPRNVAAQQLGPEGGKKKRTRGGKSISAGEQQLIDFLSGQHLQQQNR